MLNSFSDEHCEIKSLIIKYFNYFINLTLTSYIDAKQNA